MNQPTEKNINPIKSSDKRQLNPPVSPEPIPETDPPKFEFVGDVGSNTSHSYAMKSYWRRKKSKQRHYERMRLNRPVLLPFISNEARKRDKLDHPSQSQTRLANDAPSDHNNLCIHIKNTNASSIPEQLFSGISFVLASRLGQNTEPSSSHISAHHHRHFYHCEWRAQFSYYVFNEGGTLMYHLRA